MTKSTLVGMLIPLFFALHRPVLSDEPTPFTTPISLADKGAAVSLVKNYVTAVGENILDKGFIFQDFYHPDYMLLGEDHLNFVIVNRRFKVGNAYIVEMDVNMNHPGMEKLVAVDIEFDSIGQFDGFTKINFNREKWVKTFYCSKSTGKILLIDTSDNELMWCFCDSTLNWLIENSSTEKPNKKTIDKLKKVGCI
jgi:hypothetical protein